MKKTKQTLLLVVSGGMDLSWLYAWAALLMLLFAQHPFPLFEALGSFGLAAVLTALTRGKGWRIISIAGIQVCGCLCLCLKTCHAFYYRSSSFFNQRWLKDFLETEKTPLEWIVLVLLLVWSLAFWRGGILLILRPVTYRALASRFDLGILALFGILLLKLLLNQEIQIQASLLEPLLISFFLCSLLALSLARSQSHVQRDFLAGYQRIGVILSFTAIILLLGVSIVSFCLPALTQAAETGYHLIKAGTEPLLPILENILRFLFRCHGTRSGAQTSAPAESHVELLSPETQPWWLDLIEHILNLGLWGIAGFTAIIILSLMIWNLLPWLLSKTDQNKQKLDAQSLLALLIARLWSVCTFGWELIVRRFSICHKAAQLYAALQRWGHFSGIPYTASETPTEYGSRLKRSFPGDSREIELIVEAFNQETYGERVLDPHDLDMAQQALQHLRRPALWASRLKTSLLSRGYGKEGTS